MATTARSLTWFVSHEGERSRALCLQAASPSRMRSFILRRPDHFVIERAYPIDPLDQDGRELDEGARRRLLRQLQRNANENTVAAASDALLLSARIEEVIARICAQHGVDRIAITREGRTSPRLARARIHAAHSLKDHLQLPAVEIAAVLKLKHHSSVSYLLRRPRPIFPKEA